MSAEYYYSEGWFRAEKKALAIIDASTAMNRHEQRKYYNVLVGSIEQPTAFIDINNDFIAVGFLDNEFREHLTYEFEELKPRLLFLSTIYVRKFIGERYDDFEEIQTYRFKESGLANVRVDNFLENTFESWSQEADITHNYSSYPAFGSYEDLIRRDRIDD